MHSPSQPRSPHQMPRWRRSLGAAFAAWRAPPADAPVAYATVDTVNTGDELAALVTSLDVPLLLLGDQARIIAVSSGAKQLIPALHAGKPLGLIMRDPDLLSEIAAVRHSGQASQYELGELFPFERSLRIVISPVSFRPQSQPWLILTLHDLSELKTVERMRVDFVANASHELRTPLATLLGFIETLQGPARGDEKARIRFLGIMHDQARRMSRLIDDLLSLSHIEQRAHHAPSHPVDLVAIIREIIDSLSVMAQERGVIVQGPAPATSAMVAGDRDELLRLVENLVENAIKYGQNGKKVDVSIDRQADQLVLCVRDYGPGISAEHIPRLTERFYRIDVGASREVGGTGLGLAIVKHITLRHRGRLSVESELGQGSAFNVTLPLHKP